MGEDGYDEDAGFAINGGKGWSKVEFNNHNIVLSGTTAIAMGYYVFTDATTLDEVTVEYTFGYKLLRRQAAHLPPPLVGAVLRWRRRQPGHVAQSGPGVPRSRRPVCRRQSCRPCVSRVDMDPRVHISKRR